MIKYLLIFLLPLSLYASKILSYNIYDRTDRVDVMITFDTPYEGAIKQNVTDSTIDITLEETNIDSAKIKQLSSKFLQSLSITPMGHNTKIVAYVPPSVNLSASKTSDSYGLRLRFATKQTPVLDQKIPSKEVTTSTLSSLPTKKSDEMQKSYYIVVTILIIGIALLFFLKKRVSPASTIKQQTSWLFKENKGENSAKGEKQSGNNLSIRFKKPIDSENSVVMLDFGKESYLVLMGKSNVLLDKFKDSKPAKDNEFDTILQDRHKELNDFLNDDVQHKEAKEPLQAYKERAASIAYEA